MSAMQYFVFALSANKNVSNTFNHPVDSQCF